MTTAKSEYVKQATAALKSARATERAKTLAWSRAQQAHKVKFNVLRHLEVGRKKARVRREREIAQRCACCTESDRREYRAAATRSGLVADHILAIAQGGAHCVLNMQWLTIAEHAAKTKGERQVPRHTTCPS